MIVFLFHPLLLQLNSIHLATAVGHLLLGFRGLLGPYPPATLAGIPVSIGSTFPLPLNPLDGPAKASLFDACWNTSNLGWA